MDLRGEGDKEDRGGDKRLGNQAGELLQRERLLTSGEIVRVLTGQERGKVDYPEVSKSKESSLSDGNA